ncbi:M48 family metallopeptidase [Candidatus Saccharibacteria bacterium]|nr:M48 family metallopeptidase [Candidatus Saccharibacteria bacterium]
MILKDPEFGDVLVRKNAFSTSIKFSISTSGRLAMSVPKTTPNFLIKRFLNSSRAQIRVKLPIKNPTTQRARDTKKKILNKKAKEYLPYRLDFWARKYSYSYTTLRFSHANTRWGSRSSTGTISLNIGLMNLPEPLRDYVILHELAHINHMNHSAAFWAEVAQHDPNYKRNRKRLKMFTPGV